MQRVALLIVFVSVPALAGSSDTATSTGQTAQVSCELAGVEALAQAKGISLRDAIGSRKVTMAAVRFRGAPEAEVTISTSSGDAELDRIAVECARSKSRGHSEFDKSSFQTVWPNLLSASDVGYSTPPRSTGAPHVCLRNYPRRAVREGQQGTTELFFNITPAGTVDGLIVAASSGDFDLDQASAICAREWKYEPAESAGTPVEIPWDAQVAWALAPDYRAHSPLLQMPAINCLKDHPDAEERASSLPGLTVITYKLANGELSDASIRLSSGDDTLDGYAMSCVRSWRFKPSYDDGTPATGAHAAIIDWAGKKFR